ncbi:MAG: MFS transporter [Promethearchaeota archaeon]|nr:MAG: MFS transporter [Candidatus Lokiarchaeota archaeon]
MMEKREKKFSIKSAIAFGFGQFSDTIAYQMFTFLTFTFYYSVVDLNINLITLGFIIWSVWNALNDPLLGSISDRTKTRFGRRKPYILISIGPLCLIVILLWFPPMINDATKFFYFLIIITLFEFFYTMFAVNRNSLFPEIFQDLENRAKANTFRHVFSIMGLIIAFILPTLLIPKLTDSQYYSNYGEAGILIAIIMAIGAIIFIIFGTRERVEFSEDSLNAPSFLKSLKISFKNKAFRTYVIAGLVNWYVYGMLPTIIPLYGEFVLNIQEGESILLGLLLGVAFISAALFIFLWRYVAVKIGMKKGFMLSMTIFIITLIPLLFISDVISAFISFFFVGLGLSGSFMFIDVIIPTIIDYDEIETGVRRDGGYFGINALIIRLSGIFTFLTISLVFNSVGWTVFDPKGTTEQTIFGLRSLMTIFPIIALIIGIISISRFPIDKQKYQEIKIQVEELHKQKKEKVNKKNQI